MFSVQCRRAESYETSIGDRPFERWIRNLDSDVRVRVLGRLRRAQSGNLGSFRNLGEGLLEFKEEWGPGYRIYFGLSRVEEEGEVIVVLWGGTKDSQIRDIERARRYWEDYKVRTRLE